MKYRVITYSITRGRVERPTGEFRQATEMLDFLVESGQVVGGHIEKYVKGQGWVVAEEEE